MSILDEIVSYPDKRPYRKGDSSFEAVGERCLLALFKKMIKRQSQQPGYVYLATFILKGLDEGLDFVESTQKEAA